MAQSIAEVALRLLEKEGADGVSMRRVAKTVGVTPMAIYHHFPDRKALLKTITDGEFQKLASFTEHRAKTLIPDAAADGIKAGELKKDDLWEIDMGARAWLRHTLSWRTF
jgi:AcrR family transcriptional regulator